MTSKKKNPSQRAWIEAPAADKLLGMGYRFYWKDDDLFDWDDLDPKIEEAVYAPAEWVEIVGPDGMNVDSMGGVLFNSRKGSFARRTYRRQVEEEMAEEFLRGLGTPQGNPVTRSLRPRNGFEQFYVDHGLELTCKQVSQRPDAGDFHKDATHWECTLKSGKRKMKFDYSMGPLISGVPSVGTTLNDLAIEARMYDSYSFYDEPKSEIASSYKISDSEAGKLYRGLKKNYDGLQRVLGEGALEEFLALDDL